MNQEYKKYLIWHSKVIALATFPAVLMLPIGKLLLGGTLSIDDVYFTSQVYLFFFVGLFGGATLFGMAMRKINNESFIQESLK